MRVQVCFRGIDAETKLKLKIMAATRGIRLYQLLDEIVDKAWEKEADRPAKSGIARTIARMAHKEARKILETYTKTAK